MAKSRKAPRISGITIYPRGHTWSYLVDIGPDAVTGKPRRQYKGGFATDEAALTAAMEVKRTLDSGTHVRPSRRTVGEFFAQWLVTVDLELKPSTYINYCDYLNAYVLPAFGERRLQDIDVTVLNEFYRRLHTTGRRKPDQDTAMYAFWRSEISAGRTPTPAAVAAKCGTTVHAARAALTRYRRGRVPAVRGRGLAPKTVRNVHLMLHRALRDAVSWGYLVYNPAAHVSLPRSRHKNGRPAPWTADQLSTWLRSTAVDRDAAMWVLAATTGMRRSELAGARRDLLDLDKGLLVIEPTRIVVAGRAEDSDGKTQASRRTISLDTFTVSALRQHLRRLDEEQMAWGSGYEPSLLLFCHVNGRPLHPDTITRRFNRLVDRAGVPRIRLHDLRHTYATLSLDAGVHPKIVSDRVGHANMNVTLQIYAHRSTGQDRDAAETFAAGLFGIVDGDDGSDGSEEG